jgi:hypothetical protein
MHCPRKETSVADEFFHWRAFDVSRHLPDDWSEQVIEVARKCARLKKIQPPHVTSREASEVTELTIRGVSAAHVRSELPWVEEFYRGTFRDMAQVGQTLPVSCADGSRHTVVLNVQLGTDMRYEAHVDTNPIQGLLYATTHGAGEGGELVICANREARRVEDIDDDPIKIYPQRGHLVFFDGRHHAHYIRPLVDPNAIRVSIAMNYYIASWPETRRPHDLDDYLYGVSV